VSLQAAVPFAVIDVYVFRFLKVPLHVLGSTVGHEPVPGIPKVPLTQSYTATFESERPPPLVFVTVPSTPTWTATTPPDATSEAPGVQFFVIVIPGEKCLGLQVAVLDCAVGDPPPAPAIVAVTTSDPPLVLVVIVAK